MSVHHESDNLVNGHLRDVRGTYQMVIKWKTADGEWKRTSKSTGLKVRGNKKRAEQMLDECLEKKRFELERTESQQACGSRKQLLFVDMLRKWLSSYEQNVGLPREEGGIKLSSFAAHEINVKSIIVPYFEPMQLCLDEVDKEHLSEFFEERRKKVKSITLQRYHSALKMAFSWAEEKEMIEDNPMRFIKRPKAARFKANFLNYSEVIEICEKIKGHKLELGVILAAFYGLRRGEIIGLKWENISFEQNYIRICHTVTEVLHNGKLLMIAEDTTKTLLSNRTLPLVPQFREKLLQLKAEQEHYRKMCGHSYNTEHLGYIYTDPLGNLIRPDYLTRAFREWMLKQGYGEFRFHDLRHSAASLLIASGVSMKEVQEWLGHSDYKLTANTYTHLEYSSKVASAEKVTWINQTTIGSVDAENERHRNV